MSIPFCSKGLVAWPFTITYTDSASMLSISHHPSPLETLEKARRLTRLSQSSKPSSTRCVNSTVIYTCVDHRILYNPHVTTPQSYHHHDASILRTLCRLFWPTIILKIEMGHRRRFRTILWSLARVPDRGFGLRLQSRRATVSHTKRGGKRLCGQNTCRVSRL